MGKKYIKKDDDGKEILYEDMGITGQFFGNRRIGEARETDFVERALGGAHEEVKA